MAGGTESLALHSSALQAFQAKEKKKEKHSGAQVMLGLSSMALWVRLPLASPAAERDAGGAAEPREGARVPVILNPCLLCCFVEPLEGVRLLVYAALHALHLGAPQGCAFSMHAVSRGGPLAVRACSRVAVLFPLTAHECCMHGGLLDAEA